MNNLFVFMKLCFLVNIVIGTDTSSKRVLQHVQSSALVGRIFGVDQYNNIYGFFSNWTISWYNSAALVQSPLSVKDQRLFLFDNDRKLGLCHATACYVFGLDNQGVPATVQTFSLKTLRNPAKSIEPDRTNLSNWLDIDAVQQSLLPPESTPVHQTRVVILLAMAIMIVICIGTAVAGCLAGIRYRKRQEAVYEIAFVPSKDSDGGTEFHFDSFAAGPSRAMPSAPSPGTSENGTGTFPESSNGGGGSTMDMVREFSADGLIIDPQALELGAELGTGNFGVVHCAYYTTNLNKRNSSKKLVAVKKLKGLATAKDFQNLLQEAHLMKGLHHPNVMLLIGVCVTHRDGSLTESPQLVLPYMANRDLLTFVKKNVISLHTALIYGLQVAEGMAFLARCRFIHRDLAARNCMLDDEMKVKIADFGLTRDVYERNVYNRPADSESQLPVRWTAPECALGSFTSMSDVWSFGVLLWEILSNGELPYAHIPAMGVMNHVRAGRRLSIPPNCPYKVYSLMLSCWKSGAGARPKFPQLVNALQTMTDALDAGHLLDENDYLNAPPGNGYDSSTLASSQQSSLL